MLETTNSFTADEVIRIFRNIFFGLSPLGNEIFASEMVDVSCLGIDFYHGYRSVTTDARASKNLKIT